MKIFIRVVLAIVLVIVLAIAGAAFYLTRGIEAGAEIEISNVDLTTVEDGEYEGSYNSGRWTNEVRVSVKDHRITGIAVVKDVTFPKQEVTHQLVQRVMDAQSVDVDAVSGATVTCNAYLKAIENALRKQ